MKNTLTACLLAQLVFVPCAMARPHVEEPEVVPFYFSLFPPIDTAGGSGDAISPIIAVNALAGRTAGLDGFEMGTILNLKDHYVTGVQVSSVANVVRGPLRGVQAGTVNVAKRMDLGVQAGAVNVSGNAHGVQGGSINIAKDFDGAQFGAVNIAGETHGAQFGSVNVTGAMQGAQFGAVNVRGGGESHGFQSGAVNVTGDYNGAQIGTINIGKSVNGFQMGVINVAQEFKGANIGLFNFYGNGHQIFELTSQSNGFYGLGFTTGSQHFYTTLLGGARQSVSGQQLFLTGIGLGLRLPVFFLTGKAEFMSGGVTLQPGSLSEWATHSSIKGSLGLQLTNRFAIKGGAAMNWMGISPTQIGVPAGMIRSSNMANFYPTIFAGVEF